VTGAYQISVQTAAFTIVGAGQAVVISQRDEAIARAKMAVRMKTLR